MWFVLRMTFWLGVVLVLLPNVGSHPLPKSQISASQALLAAKDIVADIQHFCERQPGACVAGSQATVTFGERARVGAKILYEFLSEQFGSHEPRSVRTMGSIPIPRVRPSQHTLRPTDLAPPWRGPRPTDSPRDLESRHA
jgi:hypothetical protein